MALAKCKIPGLLIFFFIFGALNISSADDALEFRGVKIGMARTDVIKIIQNKSSDIKNISCGAERCSGETYIKNVLVEVAYVFLNNKSKPRILNAILMKYSSSDFRTIQNALIEKYGKPQYAINDQLLWTYKYGDIFAAKNMNNDPIYGALILATDSMLDQYNAEIKKKPGF